MSSVSISVIAEYGSEFREKRFQLFKLVEETAQDLRIRASNLKSKKSQEKLLKEIKQLEKEMKRAVDRVSIEDYCQTRATSGKDIFSKIPLELSQKAAAVGIKISQEEEKIKKRYQRIKNKLELIKNYQPSENIFSQQAYREIKKVNFRQLEEDIESLEIAVEKLYPVVERAYREEENLSRLKEITSMMEEPEVWQELLEEEKKLEREREVEEKERTKSYKMIIKLLSREIPDSPLLKGAKKLLEAKKVSQEQFSAFLEALAEEKEKKVQKAAETETKEKMKEKMKEKGYALIQDGEIMKFGKKDHHILMRIDQGKLTTKFVKEVDQLPNEYERLKDRQEMEQWCSLFEDIKKELQQDGIFISTTTNITSLQDVNYEVRRAVRKQKKYMQKGD